MARAQTTDSLAWRLVLQSHLLFLALAAAALAATVEGVAAAGTLGGWRVLFLPAAVLQGATPYLAFAWIVVLAGAALPALADPAGRRRAPRAGALARWMQANAPLFVGYLLALAAFKAAAAAVNLWSLRAAAPFETLYRAAAAAWPELSYAAVVGLLGWTLALVRSREGRA